MEPEEIQISFKYYANPADFSTDDAEEIASILKEQIDTGEVDISDLLDEDNIHTVEVKPAE